MIANSCVSSIGNFLSAPYTSWSMVVIAATLLILLILGIIYMLSSFMGRNNIKVWVVVKMFDVLFSLVLVIIFAGISTAFCSYNPASLYASAGLLSSSCASAANINMYSLSLCDLFQFNQLVTTFVANEIFKLLLIAAAIPKINVQISVLIGLNFAVGIPDIIANGMNIALFTLYALQLLNQVQLLILASAPILFAIFMSMGLVARLFGITRSFGGAMIAFALGVGFIYPMLVGITYGFTTYVLGNVMTGSAFLAPFKAMGGLLGLITMPSAASSLNSVTSLFSTTGNYQALEGFCLMLVGMTFIPFVNFIILDAFIVDLSSAIGERLDFLSIIERVI